MIKKYWAAFASVIITAAVVFLSRIPAMYINPICSFTAKMILAACAATVCRMPGIVPGLAYAAAVPLFAWHMDVVEGQAAVAYALSVAALLLVTKRAKPNIWLKSALSALAVALALAIYSSAVLTVSHERTFYSAVVYSLSRQLLPYLAIFIGVAASEWIYTKSARR